jgi:hypothetical protein
MAAKAMGAPRCRRRDASTLAAIPRTDMQGCGLAGRGAPSIVPPRSCFCLPVFGREKIPETENVFMVVLGCHAAAIKKFLLAQIKFLLLRPTARIAMTRDRTGNSKRWKTISGLCARSRRVAGDRARGVNERCRAGQVDQLRAKSP